MRRLFCGRGSQLVGKRQKTLEIDGNNLYILYETSFSLILPKLRCDDWYLGRWVEHLPTTIE